MPNPPEAASTKCFSAILSRLLCSGGLPTHPSEHLLESNTVKLKTPDPEPARTDENSKRGMGPGVVARLMGLESFPEAPPKERRLGDFFRSRSVNSIDFLSHLDPTKHGSRRHRRVRTSVSFREGMMHDEYASVVLLLERELKEEKKEKEKKNGMERRKSVYGKKVEKMGGSGGEASRKFQAGSGLQKKGLEVEMRASLKGRRLKKKCEEETLKKRKKKSKILDDKLNCDFKKIHSGRSIESERARGASSRKKQPSQKANAAICESVKNERKMKINENCYNKKMVEEICRLNEDDVRENWIDYGMEKKFEDFEDLCRMFGQEILEGLLRQFVDELVLHFGQQIRVDI